jgi:hypothetical protein
MQFGKQPQRYVPKEIKESTPEIINAFLDGYCLGDGSLRENGSRIFFTTSKKLADDIQELLLKVGSFGCVFNGKSRGTKLKVNGREYFRKNDIYLVRESKNKVMFYIDKRRYKHLTYPHYKGKVYCVAVPNSIIYVRRNGKPTWAGNCRLPFPCSSIQAHFIKNYADVLWAIGSKNNIRLEIDKKYYAQVGVYTEEPDTWRVIHFPDKIRDRVGFRRVVIKDGQYYFVPGDTVVATAVGMGDTPEEAIKDAGSIAEQIECSNTYVPADFFDKAMGVIEEVNKMGKGMEF